MMIRSALRFCAFAISFLPVAASAHVGAGDTHGFVHGFSHPLSGIDHVLAMVAVGLFAAHLGGRALWLVPSTFVSVMALAGIAGTAGVELPFVEIGIGMSVVVLGLAVAFQLSVPTLAATSLVGFFAIFHGHAHGAEMPESVFGLTYGVGFLCATALLHATGVGLGLAVGKAGEAYSRLIVQIGGGAIAIVGVGILISSGGIETLAAAQLLHSTSAIQLPNTISKRPPPDELWNKGFAMLLAFKEREGHCCVVRDHVENGYRLGQWVAVQRYNQDNHDYWRRAQLDKIGFVWSELDRWWEEGFAALKTFKAREGHCYVPAVHVEGDVNLGHWVRVQRRRENKMNSERRQRLNEIGLAWNGGRPLAGKSTARRSVEIS
jgi:urease accessory protein